MKFDFYLCLLTVGLSERYNKYSHYGASRLCEAASQQDVRGSLRLLGWMSDKRGSLRSLRSEVLLQTLTYAKVIIISKLATTHGTATETAKKVGTLLRP